MPLKYLNVIHQRSKIQALSLWVIVVIGPLGHLSISPDVMVAVEVLCQNLKAMQVNQKEREIEKTTFVHYNLMSLYSIIQSR